MKILAIESSADETSVAHVEYVNDNLIVHKNFIASQIDMHRTYGGIVPNLAGKFHAENIMPLLHEAAISPEETDLIAVTSGPGLMPCLVVGVSAANALAFAWQKPIIPIHHIEGHIYANWIAPAKPQFPALALVVSGGHTQLMLMHDHLSYEIIGQTQDDAVGEAYDKAARLLGLPYPGGPEIDRRAQAYADAYPDDFETTKLLTRPMLHSGDYQFSFSGLKTAVLYAVRDYQKEKLLVNGLVAKSIAKTDYESVELPKAFVEKMCFAFQEAAVDVLVTKTLKAAQEYGVQSVLLAGGVSANKKLRSTLASFLAHDCPHASFHVPAFAYCLDNGAMIGAAAAYRWERMPQKEKEDCHETVLAQSNLTLNNLTHSP